MEKAIGNEEELIKLNLINEAVGEQMKSQAADDGLDKGKRGTKAIPSQIVGLRRRTEDIIGDAIDNWSDTKIRNYKISSLVSSFEHQSHNTSESVTSSKRKTHRGKRSLKSGVKRVNQK